MKFLIVIDMQNDFITGALANPAAEAIVPKIAEYVSKWNGHLILTRDTHHSDYLNTMEGKNLPVKHCIQGTEGWDISNEIDSVINWVEAEDVTYIDKPTFGYTKWNEYELGNEIELIGLCTDICVVSNALIIKALYPEANVTVDSSCCAGVTPESHEAALKTMKMCQVNVK